MQEVETDILAGALDVPQLRRLWQRALTSPGEPAGGTEWAADQAVIYGLGLGLHETLGFLYSQRPNFAAFQHWVLECNGGSVDPARVAQVNAAVAQARGDVAPRVGFGPDFVPALDTAGLRCWDENGYVVLRQAVSPDDCRAAAQAIWEFMGLDPDMPEGWTDLDKTEGIFVPLVQHPVFERNRRSARIRNAFAQLYGTDDLQVTIDRGGFNPPGREVPRLHWDISLAPPFPRYFQGVLYLTDTPAEQGAFHCVPGFHRRLETWLASLPEGIDPRTLDLSLEAVRIAGQAGDMVIWHGALPHGASFNYGTRPRLVQYIAYHSLDRADDRPWV